MDDFKLYIPSPCHEDWNKMSGNEKDRFCSSCSKTVMDFSTSSKEEIKNYFLENVNENVCGRFRNDQLAGPVRLNIPSGIFENQLSFSQCFIISLLLAFGSILFSLHATGQEARMVGEVQLTKSSSDSVSVSNIHRDDSIAISDIIDSIDIDSSDVIPMNLDGLAVDSPISDTTYHFALDKINTDSVELFPDSVYEVITFGDVYVVTGCVTAENPIDPNIQIDSSLPHSPLLPGYLSEIYPNPAHDVTNLRIKSDYNSTVIITIFDLSGKAIRVLVNEYHILEGENNIPLDLGGIPPSQYVLQIRCGEAVETKRIVII